MNENPRCPKLKEGDPDCEAADPLASILPPCAKSTEQCTKSGEEDVQNEDDKVVGFLNPMNPFFRQRLQHCLFYYSSLSLQNDKFIQNNNKIPSPPCGIRKMQKKQQQRLPQFQPDYNIQQRVRADEKYREFHSYANKMQAIGMTTSWHEGHQKFEIWRKNKMSEKQISQELGQANQELKILRAARLKELYLQESEQYEKELNDQGYAILKDRL